MISEQVVWDEVWPVVEKVIEATLGEDGDAIRPYLVPKQQADLTLTLYGHGVFDILLKTVLGRGRLAVTKAVETENGQHVHIEFVWPDSSQEGYTAADTVSVQLQPSPNGWLVREINPAAIDLPLTSARARGILASTQVLNEVNQVPSEPWIIPIAFYAGMLQLPLEEEAMTDEVDTLFLAGLQHRTYGAMAIVRTYQLWQDYKAKAKPDPSNNPNAWAAAVEFIASEQHMREQTQAQVAKLYETGMTKALPRIKNIKKVLGIEGLDERYTDIQALKIEYTDK